MDGSQKKTVFAHRVPVHLCAIAYAYIHYLFTVQYVLSVRTSTYELEVHTFTYLTSRTTPRTFLLVPIACGAYMSPVSRQFCYYFYFFIYKNLVACVSQKHHRGLK